MIPIQPATMPGGVPVIYSKIFAKNQPDLYDDPLPALSFPSTREGQVLTEWEFTAEELAAIVNGGRLRLWVYTFRNPLQPVRLEVVE